MVRSSAGPGEQEAARWAAARLEECGAAGVGVERYSGRTTNSWSFATHSAVALAGQLLGGVGGALVALASLVSLERDASGRSPWRRRLAGGALAVAPWSGPLSGADALKSVAPRGLSRRDAP